MAGKCLRTGSSKLHSWTKRSGKWLTTDNQCVTINANHNKSIVTFSLLSGAGGREGFAVIYETRKLHFKGEIRKRHLQRRISLQAGPHVGFWARFRFADSRQLRPREGIRRQPVGTREEDELFQFIISLYLSLDVLLRTLLFLIFQMPEDRKHVPGKFASMSKSPARMKIVLYTLPSP